MRFIVLAAALLLATAPLSAQSVGPVSGLPLADESFAQASGAASTLRALAGERGTVLVFWANKCAWVDRYEARLLALAEAYRQQGYSFVLVNSFGPANAAEVAERSVERARARGYTLPYIVDREGALARAVGAKRAPQVFVYDAAGALRYQGAIDDKPSDAAGVSNFYLRDALDASLRGTAPAMAQTEALGCLIAF